MSDGMISIAFTCASDSSESYKEKDVPLSIDCNLMGIRHITVNKSFTHKIQVMQKAVVTLVKDLITSHWHMADENGSYDQKWYMNEHMSLENVKLMQGLVIRGTLRDISYCSNKKYCKQIESNKDKFFTKDKLPVMTAKLILIDSRGTVYGRGIK